MNDNPDLGTVDASFDDYDEDALVSELAQEELEAEPEYQENEDQTTEEPEEQPDDEPEEDDGEPEEDKTDWTAEIADKSFKLPDGTEVNGQEVINGYLRQADYSRKTRDLAIKGATVEDDVRNQVMSSYQPRLEALEQLLTHYAGAGIDQNLRYTDPEAYDNQVAFQQRSSQILANVQQEKQLLEQEQQAHQEKINNVLRQRAVGELSKWRPELLKDEARGAYQAKLNAYAKANGMDAGELDLNKITEPGIIKLVDKAMRFDEMEAAKGTLDKADKGQKRSSVLKGKSRNASKASKSQFEQKLNKASKSGEKGLQALLAGLGG